MPTIKNGANKKKNNQQKIQNKTTTRVLLEDLEKLFGEPNHTALIMADTIMLACKFTPEEIKVVTERGLQAIPEILSSKKQLNDHEFVKNLFALDKEELEQLPISYFEKIVQSKSFTNFNKAERNKFFGKIFDVLGISKDVELGNLEPDNIAYNYISYKTILQEFYYLNRKNDKEYNNHVGVIDNVIDNKMSEVLANAPELTNNPDRLQNFAPYKNHKGDLDKITEDTLSLFNDTKDLKKENIQAMGMGDVFQQSARNAKIVIAQSKLGAYREAAKFKGLIDDKTAENFSVTNPAEKEKPINKFIDATKDVKAYFSKPQNIAKFSIQYVKSSAITMGANALLNGAVPCVGGIISLGTTLVKALKRTVWNKEKPSEVLKQVAPDLARGAVAVAAGVLVPLPLIGGPLSAVAGITTKGIINGWKEGYRPGKGLFKRMTKEFKTKESIITGIMTGVGMGIGAGLTASGAMGVAQEGINDVVGAAKDKVGDVFSNLFSNDTVQQGVSDIPMPASAEASETYTQAELNAMGITPEPTVQVVDPGDLTFENVAPATNEFLNDDNGIEDVTANDQFMTPEEAVTQGITIESGEVFNQDSYGPQLQPEQTENFEGRSIFAYDENGNLRGTGNVTTMADSIEMSYADQYIAEHPGAHYDSNGWVQNANGSYPKNESGQLFGNENRVFREVGVNEKLDENGNIVNNVSRGSTTNIEMTTGTTHNADYLEKLNAFMADKGITNEKLAAMAAAQQNDKTNIETMIKEETLTEPEPEIVREPAPEPYIETTENNNENQVRATRGIEPRTAQSENEIPFVVGNGASEKGEISIEEAYLNGAQNETPNTQEVVQPDNSADIAKLQHQAIRANEFNSLSENHQLELIKIHAEAQVALENGDERAYQVLTEKYEKQFQAFHNEDRMYDHITRLANIPGTEENIARTEYHNTVKEAINNGNKGWKAMMDEGTRIFGHYNGVKDGTKEYVQISGTYDRPVPDVPLTAEAMGFTKLADGTYIKVDGNFTTKVNDPNWDGIWKPGLQIEETMSRQGADGVVRASTVTKVVPEPDLINQSHNEQTALNKAINDARPKYVDLDMENNL